MIGEEPTIGIQTIGAGDRPRVLIIGGGFGGVFAARRLKRADADVILLDRGTSHLFQPLLYQTATGILSEGQISTPLRRLFRNYKNLHVVLGEATDIDVERGVVRAHRPGGAEIDLPYDYLVLAAGTRQSYFGHNEFAEFAPGLKTLDDALAVRRRIFGAFEYAESLPYAEQRAPWLTFALVGAGPTGVELAGQIRELALKTIREEFKNIDPAECRVLLFDATDMVLQSFGKRLSGKATKTLTKLGVEPRLGTMVTAIDENGLETKDKDGNVSRIEAKTVLWTAGVEAVPFATRVAKATGAEQDRAGRIYVEEDLTIAGHPNIWVLGDLINLNGLPGVAEVALQGGLFAGGRIKRLVKGKGQPLKPKKFKYRDLGNAAYVSKWNAVVETGPWQKIKLSGFLGWVVWSFIHIAFLAGFRNRAATMVAWLFAITRGSRSERAITYGDVISSRQPYQKT